METIKEIEKVMNQAGISLPHFREYCINWITDSPNLDPVLIIEDVMKLESNHLKKMAKENGGRQHLEIINGGKPKSIIKNCGEEFDEHKEARQNDISNPVGLKCATDNFVSKAVGITETD